MTVIKAVKTALPDFKYSKDEIIRESAGWMEENPHQRELFERFLSSAQISFRHFALPVSRLLELKGSEGRVDSFKKEGEKLLLKVAGQCIDMMSPGDREVTYSIFTSCSVPTIPSIDVSLVGSKLLRPTVKRIPLYQHGCAGGVVGLGVAHELLKPGQRALLSSVELCSLVYQPADLSGGNLVGSAIFGDGAASVLLDAEGDGLSIKRTRSYLLPQSEHLMGYSIKDDGTHLMLDRALPQMLAEFAPGIIQEFLRENDLVPSNIDWWLFHPGGVKVLQVLEEALGIERECSRWAWEVLRDYGNMSSASVLFVLEKFLASQVVTKGDRVCMIGVGPGLTVEMVVFEYQ